MRIENCQYCKLAVLKTELGFIAFITFITFIPFIPLNIPENQSKNHTREQHPLG